MFNIGGGRNKTGGGKRKRVPALAVVFISGFVLIPAFFFIYGMRESPGRDAGLSPPTITDSIAGVSPAPSSNPDDQPLELTPTPMPPAVRVKGIYYNIYFPENNALGRCTELIESTALNAIVIDVKEDHGFFTFETDNRTLQPASDEFLSRYNAQPITSEQIADLNTRGIYTIARVVCFRDDYYARANPTLALQSKSGSTWRDGSVDRSRWLNPYNRDCWEYLAEVCREAVKVGFQEIQLDYVRFPSEGSLSDINYGQAAAEQTRYQTINEFVTYIRDEMAGYGVRTSADIFAFVGISPDDAAAVGQNVQLLLGSLDSISPMIYPSHFANSSETGAMGNGVGQFINGILFERPDTEPYSVVYNTLQHYVRQVEQFRENDPDAKTAVIRPYLQYFTANYLPEDYFISYGPQEIHAQIKAVNDAGFDEWILWRQGDNNYAAEAIPADS